MKKVKITLSIAAFLFTAVVLVSSCKKSTTTTPTPDSDVTGANDNSLAETHANDIMVITAEASESQNGSLSTFRTNNPNSILTSATVVQYPSIGIDTITFSSTSPCADGRVRSGKIVLNYSGSSNGAAFYRQAGFSCKITTINYVVDGNQVIVNTNSNNAPNILTQQPISTNTSTYNGDLNWTITLNLSIVKANNTKIQWTCARTKYLLNTYAWNGYAAAYSGPNNPIKWSIAVIAITDALPSTPSSTGTDAAGENFVSNITNPLIRNFSCNASTLLLYSIHPIVQGTINFTPGTKAVRTIDYGTGTCDLNATVTIAGVSYPITLP
jgi:hypothetical protein